MRKQRLAAFPLVATAYFVAAGATTWADTTTTEGGYEIKRWQTVASAPTGSVGRKTTDHETRSGIEPATQGNSSSMQMTLGAFVKKCPSAEGVVDGEFEYSLTRDETSAAGGQSATKSFVKGINAELKGKVGDDARVQYAELDGQYTRGDGSPAERIHVRFTPDQSGQPDFEAMRTAVEQTGDMSIAIAMWQAAPVLRDAQTEWQKKNACVELVFDPQTDSVVLGPGEAANVRTALKTKVQGAPVAGGNFNAGSLGGIGRLSPTQGTTSPDPMTLTYTASVAPRRGQGFDIAVLSRAGVAAAQWRISEATRFDSVITQSQTYGLSPAGANPYAVRATSKRELTAKLRWTPDANPAHQGSFGDVASTFYVPSDGEIEVAARSDGTSAAGTCTEEGSKTFALRDLPPDALKYLSLEVAADGRYQLMLGMMSYYLQFHVTERCTGRNVPAGRGSVLVNDVGIGLGRQEGRLDESGEFTGQTSQPIVLGPISITGTWRFTKSEPSPQP